MKLSNQSTLDIRAAIKDATNKYADPSFNEGVASITDFHIMAKPDNGEIIIYDDDDNELSKCIISEWAEVDEMNFENEIKRTLRQELTEINQNGYLDELNIIKPFSFFLVDENMETLAELMLIDEDTVIVDDELMKGLDEELNDFFNKLMEE